MIVMAIMQLLVGLALKVLEGAALAVGALLVWKRLK